VADNSQKTEKPTPRRLQKAREKGDFPAAKEFVGAAQFMVFIVAAVAWFPGWMDHANRRGAHWNPGGVRTVAHRRKSRRHHVA